MQLKGQASIHKQVPLWWVMGDEYRAMALATVHLTLGAVSSSFSSGCEPLRCCSAVSCMHVSPLLWDRVHAVQTSPHYNSRQNPPTHPGAVLLRQVADTAV